VPGGAGIADLMAEMEHGQLFLAEGGYCKRTSILRRGLNLVKYTYRTTAVSELLRRSGEEP